MISSIEQLTELREALYLAAQQLIIKERNPGTARWERCRGRCVGSGHRALQVPRSPRASVCSRAGSSWSRVLLGFYGGSSVWALLIRPLAAGD